MPKHESSLPAVLIVAYRRHKNVERILEECLAHGIKSIYITIDAPNEYSSAALSDHRQMLQVIDFVRSKLDSTIQMHVQIAKSNYGCAVSVIRGCDWAFMSASNLIVIEDDCLPNSTFFEFSKDNFENLDIDKGPVILCGTQFAPSDISGNLPMLSRYPLTWGWGTNREIWQILRKSFMRDSKFMLMSQLLSVNSEQSFWRAGSRRALSGFTDVWDTILVEFMLKNDLKSILPPKNLILNNGNDSAATHIALNSEWTNLPVYSDSILKLRDPKQNENVENWIREFCYHITIRHFFSTKITLMKDYMFPGRRKFRSQLRKRIFNARFRQF
jgi:hypothetical protein